MENRSRGMQLSIILLGLGAAFFLASPADAFYPRLRTGRDIEHHQHYHNCPPDCPGNHVGLLPIHDGKYPPVGKSAHYHPQVRPPYYGNQPSYNIQPIFDGQQPPHNAPPVTYDGPPPSYRPAPPPPSYEQPPPPSYPPAPPPPSYEQLSPPLYEQPPPSLYEQPPPSLYEQPQPPYNAPPPQYNAPPPPYSAQSPPYNSVPLPPPPPPYNLSPPRDAPPPPSIYVPPLYNSHQSPFHHILYDSRPSINLPPAHHQAPRPSYEQPPAQDNSQPSVQLLFESPEQKNNSSPPAQLNSKDIAFKLESNDSSTSLPTESTDSPLHLPNPSSSDSESALPLVLPDYASNGAPESPLPDQIDKQISDEPSNTVPFNAPTYTLYSSPIPRTYQATMAYERNPPWKEVHSEYHLVAPNYDRPPSQSLTFNRIPRKFDYEPFSLPEYRPRSLYEPDAGGFDSDYGKTLRHFSEFEREPSDGFLKEFDRQAYRYPGDENPYKPYRPYKRHDHYVQNNYDLENERGVYHQYQPYVDAIRGQQQSIVPPGLDISQGQLESIIKQAIYEVRREEAEELASRRYGYESPYAEEPPAFVTMHQPKRYQLESYSPEEPAQDIEWTPVDSVPADELDLGNAGLAEEQPPRADLLEDLKQPPPTVTEPTIVDLLPTTSMSR